MTKWEYTSTIYNGSPDIRDLNHLGSQGWEMVGLINVPTGTKYYFKREVLTPNDILDRIKRQ